MARPLRVEFPDAFYHVTARGNERKRIYQDDDDRHCYVTAYRDAGNVLQAIKRLEVKANHDKAWAKKRQDYEKLLSSVEN